MNIPWGSLRPTLGPLPCIACGRMVVYGVATHVIEERAGSGVGYDVLSPVLRRDLYDKSTQQPHECRARRAVAA